MFTAIENYCDDKPHENSPNTIIASSFTRTLNSTATLRCSNRYTQSSPGNLVVTCLFKSAFSGVWSSTIGTCSMPYLLFRWFDYKSTFVEVSFYPTISIPSSRTFCVILVVTLARTSVNWRCIVQYMRGIQPRISLLQYLLEFLIAAFTNILTIFNWCLILDLFNNAILISK